VALARDQIVAAALAVADREGPEAIGIRRVARELRVTPMALYRYVEGKDELLDVVRTFLWSRVDVETSRRGWRNELRGIARAFRQLVGEHPAAPALLSTGSGESEAERRICDFMLASFQSAGFDAETAELLYLQFSHFVLALVRLDSTEERDGRDGFELGLDLFLGGVAALRSKR
jgi:AcrR family transcriptional regulator